MSALSPILQTQFLDLASTQQKQMLMPDVNAEMTIQMADRQHLAIIIADCMNIVCRRKAVRILF